MLSGAFEAGLQPEFVLADEVYGSDSKLRRFRENRKQPFVVAVKCGQHLWAGFRQRRVDDLVAEILTDAWIRMSVGDGAKGPRLYDWAAAKYGAPTEKGLIRWLLIRENIETGELAYYLCTAPTRSTAKDLAIAAGWHRHITLSMFAPAFLTVVRAAATSPGQPRSSSVRSRSKSAATSSRSRGRKCVACCFK